MNKFVLARYISGYADGLSLSQTECLFSSKEEAIKWMREQGYAEDEIGVSGIDHEYGWEIYENVSILR